MPGNIQRPTVQAAVSSSGFPQNENGDKIKTLLGWTLSNIGSGSAQALFRNGQAGDILIDVQLQADESVGESLSIQNSFYFADNLYLEVVSGLVRGSVRGRSG